MTLEQRAHDIGIAFASVKMQARISANNNDEHETLERQYLDFITDYSFASAAFISSNANLDSD